MTMNYSVLMSVYAKEKPEYLKTAIESMLNQTVCTNDFVLVCDGQLTPELDAVIEMQDKNNPNIFNILRLKKNMGLGNALNAGIQLCKNDLIARMDSDDISLLNRCELQLKAFYSNPQLSLCSGNIAEFELQVADIKEIRQVPVSHEEIIRYAKTRNPMNHMAVMFKKSAVINSGGYIEMSLAEDYYLWVRMLQKGYRALNLDCILVYARVGNGMYARRGGLSYAKRICALQKKFLQLKFITPVEFVMNCLIRILGSIAPNFMRKALYSKKLRKHI